MFTNFLSKLPCCHGHGNIPDTPTPITQVSQPKNPDHQRTDSVGQQTLSNTQTSTPPSTPPALPPNGTVTVITVTPPSQGSVDKPAISPAPAKREMPPKPSSEHIAAELVLFASGDADAIAKIADDKLSQMRDYYLAQADWMGRTQGGFVHPYHDLIVFTAKPWGEAEKVCADRIQTIIDERAAKAAAEVKQETPPQLPSKPAKGNLANEIELFEQKKFDSISDEKLEDLKSYYKQVLTWKQETSEIKGRPCPVTTPSLIEIKRIQAERAEKKADAAAEADKAEAPQAPEQETPPQPAANDIAEELKSQSDKETPNELTAETAQKPAEPVIRTDGSQDIAPEEEIDAPSDDESEEVDVVGLDANEVEEPTNVAQNRVGVASKVYGAFASAIGYFWND